MSEVEQLKAEIEILRRKNMYKEKEFDEMRCRMEHDRECCLRQMEDERRKMECRYREMECRCEEIKCRYEQEIREKNCEIYNLRRQVSDLENRLRH